MQPCRFFAMAACASIMATSVASVPKHETDVFLKWIAWQQVYHDRSIAELSTQPPQEFAQTLRAHYLADAYKMRALVPFLSKLTNGTIAQGYCNIASQPDRAMMENFTTMYDQIDRDMPAFVEWLLQAGIADNVRDEETQKAPYQDIIDQYQALTRLMLASGDTFKENEFILAFANRCFEYCYSDETFPHYQKLLTNHNAYPVVRFLATVLWHTLVGEGWRHWHAQTLSRLKECADRGDEIVYIAGGTDVYHLLRSGIYNITIIDPFLPTQERFYSEGWQLLIADDAVNTEIRFGPACNSIKMRCVGSCSQEPFSVRLSTNQYISIKKSIITWHIFDRDNKQIGHLIIHRRPVVQNDFASREHAAFLMSYDEELCIAMPDFLDGWGIDPLQLPADFTMHIKQLRKPITKNMMLAMRTIALLNNSDVRFIKLMSDPT